MDEPIADEVRGILDGHVVLERAIAARGHFPAVDVGASISRVMTKVTSEEHRNAASTIRSDLALYESKRDLILLGAYSRGSDRALDRAIERMPAIDAFLAQRPDEFAALAQTQTALAGLAGSLP